MQNPTYVIGHRNPDADAICSAIGYAALKHAQGETHCVAARCGNSNARIDAILNRFGVPLPQFVGDVTPRVRDIMNADVKQVTKDATCAEALALIDQFDIRALPVVNGGGRLAGMISVFDLGQYFIPRPNQEKSMRKVFTSLNDIVRALKAEAVHLEEPERIEELFVRIGAMDLRSFGRYYSEDLELAKSSVIVVGDRYDIQMRSIQTGVRMIVITGGLPVEDDVVKMAQENGVSIIVSPDDSATTSWIIRSAGRVERAMTETYQTFSPDDKLSFVRRKMMRKGVPTYLVVDEEERLVGLFTGSDLLKPIQTNLILVDHNELAQSVPGADLVNITEIVDHHRLGNPPSAQPIMFINIPLGSTCTIVADLFQRNGLTPEPGIAGVLMGGIITDTLNLQGPTTTPRDAELLGWLSEIAGTSADDLAEMVFSSGSVILNQPASDVIEADMKRYEEGEISYSVSQIEELGFDNFLRHRQALEDALCAMRERENIDLAALFVTDINTQNSLLLLDGPEEIIANIPYPHREVHDVFELNGIVSRKKQLIPFFTSLLRNMQGVAS